MPGGKTILGIDLRVASVKVVEIEKGALKNWGMVEVPMQLLDKHPQLEDAKADALKKLIRAGNIRTRDAVVVAAGSEAFVKLLTLSELSRAEAADIIKWKLAEEISFPIEEAIFDFYPLPRRAAFADKIDYVAACIHKKMYLETLYILNRAGLKLAGVTVMPEALQELYLAELTKTEDEIVSVIYMGKRTTNISLFRGGRFEFNRELNIGGENITKAMSGIMVSPEGRIEISQEEAEKIKTEHGIPLNLESFPKLGEIPISQLQAMVRPALEKIQSEVARTFEYFKGQTGEGAVNRVILTGGSALTPNLKEFLGQGLGIAIETPEPVKGLDQRLSAAAGAALSGARKINLLPGEIKYRWKILARKLKKPQALVFLFAGLLALVYLFFWLQSFVLQRELARIDRKLADFKLRVSKLDAIERASREEEKRRIALKSYEQKRSKMTQVFEEISILIPQSITINSMNLTAGSIHLWGIVFKKGEAPETVLSRFVLLLSTSPAFEEMKLVQAVKNSDYATDAFNFEIIGKIKER